jgi:hypothetical protein
MSLGLSRGGREIFAIYWVIPGLSGMRDITFYRLSQQDRCRGDKAWC